MTETKCCRCGHVWLHDPDFSGDFRLIYTFCPDCIPLVLPRIWDAPKAVAS